MKPEKLKIVTILLSLFNLYGIIGLFFLNTAAEKFRVVAVATVVIVTISYIVIFFFWCGKNWARLLILLSALLSIPNIYNFQQFHIVSKFVMSLEFLFALFLIYWLNTTPVKDFFANNQKSGE